MFWIGLHSAYVLCFYIGFLLSFFRVFGVQRHYDDEAAILLFFLREYWPMLLILSMASAENFFLKNNLTLIYLTCVVFFFATIFRRNSGLNISLLGGLLNFLVIGLNDGKMPNPDWVVTVSRCPITSDTRLIILTDWMFFRGFWISIGDVFLYAGSLIFLIYQIYLFMKEQRKMGIKP